MKKQVVFAFLFIFFLVYSVVVYTNGTSHVQGQEFYNGKAREGKLLFQQYNCIACHQVYGLGGYMGPDLTNALSRSENAEVIARAYLQSGTNKMPNFELKSHEIDALIAWLKYLDQSGTYPLTQHSTTWIGTVHANSKK